MWLKLPAGFSFAGNLGYADSKFLSDSAITGYLSGTAIPDSPKVTSSVTLRNVQPLTGAVPADQFAVLQLHWRAHQRSLR